MDDAIPVKTRHDDALYVGTLEKGTRVLGAFLSGGPDLSLQEIITASGLERSAVQRIVHTYVQLGWLRRNPRTRRVTLTPSVLDLAYAYLSRNRLVEIATAHLTELQRAIRERVNLCVLDGPTIIYLVRLHRNREKFMTTVIGRRLPCYCTAGGRAILAHMPLNEARSHLTRSKLVSHTSHTETDPGKILDAIAEARTRGFAVQIEQYRHGEIAVAAPVFDETGRAIGAVSTIGNLGRCDVDNFVARTAFPVMEAAQAISRLEYHGETL